MAEQLPDNPEFEPLSRTQVLIAMGVTAIVLLLIARLWMQFGAVSLLSFHWSGLAVLQGLGLGIAITAASSLVYYTWSAYRQSADYYLELVLKPLVWPDLIWLGLLPGLSEELLFRGVMLPAFGLDNEGLVLSSLCFGVLHLSSLRQWPYVVWATVIGGALGAGAIATGNLLVPIVAHISTNLISSSLWKWGERNRSKG
ncbi:CPBP family intramembrane glutamic endopeptidase [Leptothermofonsia sp. ETS-13]|uniref:CPBP family intramembrane glutamic endopeptidase n=1 Tax=Leptothermofonsia sp. ETS-13 TaxID=3035696 RepID=UPI003BA277E2